MRVIVRTIIILICILKSYAENEEESWEQEQLLEHDMQKINKMRTNYNETIARSFEVYLKKMKHELKQKQSTHTLEYNEKDKFYADVICGFQHIKTILETVYPNTTIYGKPPKEFKSYDHEYCYVSLPPADINELIIQDEKWLSKFNKPTAGKNKTHYNNVCTFKKTWINYFFSDEGKNLTLLVAPESFTSETRNALIIRFAYSMARLFPMGCAAHHKLIDTLLKKTAQQPEKPLVSHLAELVPLWSCTAEQIKLFNLLAKHSIENFHDLKGAIFKIAKIGGKQITFVVPYTNKNCGIRAQNHTDMDFNAY